MSAVSLAEKMHVVSFRNEQISCTILKIDSLNDVQVKREILNLTSSAPQTLYNLPLILNFNIKTNFHATEQIKNFYYELSKIKINIVGVVDNQFVRNNPPPWPIIVDSRKSKPKSIESFKTTRIDHRVRSGEKIEAIDSHLVIIGNVGSGAEISASGNIYVLGSIQGKAFAGMSGAEQACIFCQGLDAELIAISGIYALNDETQKNYSGNIKIYLDDESLIYQQIR